MTRAAVLLALAGFSLASCDLSMKEQPRNDHMESAQLWQDGPTRQPPPEGTIAEDDVARARALERPPALTKALLDRGQERYSIYCSVCHGEHGDGDGRVVKRGFPPPPSYHIARLQAAKPAYIVKVITNGYGVMYSYADRVEPRDRWAIAAYVKTLQAAGPGPGVER